MLNYIWVIMLGIGLIAGIANGKIDEITDVLLSSSSDAVEFCIGILGITALWCGMIKILQEAGAIDFVSRLLEPLIHKLFPETRTNATASKHIITNITANLFGLGNGATPSGIAAVRELQNTGIYSKSGSGEVASDSVCLFLVINATAFQLIPSTVIAVLSDAGSTVAAKIIVPVWVVSFVSMISGIITFYICKKLHRKNAASFSVRRAGNRRRVPS